MSYRLEIGLTLLLAAAIGLAIWAAKRSPKVPTSDGRASTFLTGPRGSRGLHEVLLKMGRPSERRRTSLFSLTDRQVRPGPPAILAVLNPPLGLQDAELDQVVAFVRDGGMLVAAGRAGGITRCAGWQIGPEGFRDDSVAIAGYHELRLPRTARWLTPRKTDKRAAGPGLKGLVKGTQANDRCAELVPARIDTIVVAANGHPVILRLGYRGGGAITLAADVGWFTNMVWRNTDVPVLLLPLFTPRPARPGRVAWDEYHQGFGRDGGPSFAARTWTWLTGTPAGWAILQLVAVALVWLAVTAVRFGPARHVIQRKRRSPIEHLEALGAGLESASDADTAVQRLALGLRRRLNRTGQIASGDVGPWLESLELATRGPLGRSAVRRLRHLIIERDSSGERVLATAQAVEDVWEEIRPRKTRD